MRRYTLANDVVVQGPQLLPDAGLHFAAKPYLAFALSPAHRVPIFHLGLAGGRWL